MAEKKKINKKTAPAETTSADSDKIVRFRRDPELLGEVADDMLDEDDVRGALKLLLEIEADGEEDYTIYRKIADLYTELEMFKRSVNYWFKFLDAAPKRCYAEAYNGIAGNFYLMHADKLAAYYFNLQINDKGDADFPFDDMMYELFSVDEPPEDEGGIRVYDKAEEEDGERVEWARRLAENNPDASIELLEKINEGSKYYGEARYLEGALMLEKLEFESAFYLYGEAFKGQYLVDVSLTNRFALSFLIGDEEGEKSAFDILDKEGYTDTDTAVKFFSLFYGCGRHDLAFRFAESLKRLLPDSGDIDFYYAVAAYNVKKYDVALKEFNEYYSLTNEYYASLYAGMATIKSKKEKAPNLIPYTFGMPADEVEALVMMSNMLLNLKPSEIRANEDGALDFVVSSLATDNPELHAAAFHVASIINDKRCLKLMSDYLIKDDAYDPVKTVVLTLLVEMGNENPVGLVMGHIHSRVPFEHVEFNDACGDLFRSAYALAFGRFAPYCEKDIYKLRISAYDLYYKFLESGNVRKIKRINSLAALMLKRSGLNFLKNDEKEYIKYMGTTAASVAGLEALLEN